MKLGILSRKASLYSTRRLKEAAEQNGHEVRVVNYLRCYMDVTAHRPKILSGGEKLRFDAIIPRIGASQSFYGTAVVRQFEVMGVFPANSSQAIARSRDKLHALQLLSRKGIAMPVTGFVHSTKDIEGVLASVGGAPVVVKLLEGTQGLGVVLAETKKAAESVIGAFRHMNANILVQEYIKDSAGSDIRAFVVGRRVVAAMERTAAPGEFRSNIHRGGETRRVKLSPEERSIAVRASRTLGLGVAGVDMMRSNHGAVVVEVNSSPGLEGIESVTGVDVAAAVMRYLEKKVPGEKGKRSATK